MTRPEFDDRPRSEGHLCTLSGIQDLLPVFDSLVQLSLTERLVLFSLVLGTRPLRAVEIGSFSGGSAVIIVKAMDLLDFGELVMIDPQPQISPEVRDQISHRVKLVDMPSPDAFYVVDGKFDFAFVDGLRTEQGVFADLLALTPRMNRGGIILLHDILHEPVKKGAMWALDNRPDLMNCGNLCINPSFDFDGIPWAGLAMFRKG